MSGKPDGLNKPDAELDFVGYRGVAVHPYPATMPLPLAEDLLLTWSEPESLVLDPFAGSGTTLVASTKNSRRSVGIDLNPLACLIARVNLMRFSSTVDLGELDWIRKKVLDALSGAPELEPSSNQLARVERWFDPVVVVRLGKLCGAVAQTTRAQDPTRDFCMVVLSRTVRRCSRARLGELKLWRREEAQPSLDPFEVFNHEFLALARDFAATQAVIHPLAPLGTVIHGDSSRVMGELQAVDLVLTSPPYGDAWTTVAYGNFSMLSRIWLGAIDSAFVESDPASEDKLSVGGTKRPRELAFRRDSRQASGTLEAAYGAVYRSSPARAEDLLRFSDDMYEVCVSMRKCLSPNATVVMVVGPRQVSGVTIDSGQVFVEFLESLGMRRLERRTRRVSGKRLPSRTVQGQSGLGDTINDETIDILGISP